MALSGDGVPYQNTVTVANNREVNPRLVLTCATASATVKYLRNDSTGRTVWFNYTMLPNERLKIDFSPMSFGVVSSFFGDVTGRAILRGSDMTQFKLLPGSNYISALMEGAGTITATIEWPLRYWSSDGVAA